MMPIHYPRYLSWKIILSKGKIVEDYFSSKTKKRIKKSFPLLSEAGYVFKKVQVDRAFLEIFLPLYEKLISQKERGTVFDVKKVVQEGWEKGRDYGAFALYNKKEELQGALLYSIREESLSSAYRVFPNDFIVPLPIGLGYVCEFLFFEEAIAQEKSFISHGRDRNGYGRHSNIGLAEYKLRIGCLPFVSTSPQNELLTLDTFSGNDELYFLGQEPDEQMKQAFLLSAHSEISLRQMYPMLFEYQSVIGLEIIPPVSL